MNAQLVTFVDEATGDQIVGTEMEVIPRKGESVFLGHDRGVYRVTDILYDGAQSEEHMGLRIRVKEHSDPEVWY